jgi:hypothetical protein
MAQSKVDASPLESVGPYELPSHLCIGLLMLTNLLRKVPDETEKGYEVQHVNLNANVTAQ